MTHSVIFTLMWPVCGLAAENGRDDRVTGVTVWSSQVRMAPVTSANQPAPGKPVWCRPGRGELWVTSPAQRSARAAVPTRTVSPRMQ